MTELSDRTDPAIRTTPGRTPIGRAWNSFIGNPSSVRKAIRVIIAANVTVVLVGGLLITVLDPGDYPDIWRGFWYVLQTITTVGYGDVTPVEPIGKVIGALIMLTAIGSLSILTAFITSAFVEARQRGRHGEAKAEEAAYRQRLETRLNELVERLERIEQQGSRGT